MVVIVTVTVVVFQQMSGDVRNSNVKKATLNLQQHQKKHVCKLVIDHLKIVNWNVFMSVALRCFFSVHVIFPHLAWMVHV